MFSSNTSQVAQDQVFVEDVFSTYLYTGNSSTQTITNGIDLSTKGGLVWMKDRTFANSHQLYDTARGVQKRLMSDSTSAQGTETTGITAFNTNGWTMGAQYEINDSASRYASWTFRKQPKFFDVVTYTGNGSTQAINHSLGSVPGCIIIKSTSSGSNWVVYHRSLGEDFFLKLNLTDSSQYSTTVFDITAPTSTNFTVGSNSLVNTNGATYVAYLFAHNAGGFGLTGTDNVISCGSYTGTGSAGNTITLGYEPQWLLIKRTDSTGDWAMFNNMMGMTLTDDTYLWANLASIENTYNVLAPTATGFVFQDPYLNASGGTFIYIAIRRGPMKTPTTGTSVFYPQTVSQANTIDSTNVPFPPDLVNTFSRDGTDRASLYDVFTFVDRLRGLGVPSNTYTGSGPTLTSSSTAAENTGTGAGYVQLKADGQNITRSSGWNDPMYGNWIYYFMRRAPGFFDVVCYTGNATARTLSHNLGVVPELMIVKRRDSLSAWSVWNTYIASLDATNIIELNSTGSATSVSSAFNSTSPTSSVFTVGTAGRTNSSGGTYVAYLFATCPGVSKVGSYTGTGTTKQIDCGFTGGARFVLIKRTDSSGDWYVWDSARGIVAGNDSYLVLNSTAAEVTTTDWVDTYSAGFELSNAAGNNVNVNGGTYIFLAIA